MDNLSLLSSYPDNDNDSISDDSRKIRKQRNTYQKIPDDIRVQLLECVQNGETLKAAAKRFKVNYSSAKSILHTYRKEGRILKKAAQERCVKKRDNSVEDDDIVPATKPSTKKETAKTVADESEIPHVAAERTVSVSTCATLSDENRPTVSNIVQNEDIVGAGKMDQSQECDKALNQRPIMNLISQDHGPHGYMTRRKRSIQLLDSFFSQPDFHFPEHGGADTGNNVTGNQYHTDEYSSFNDMMSAFHRKASYSGDLFNDYTGFLGTKVLTPVNGQENNKTFKFDHSENLGHYHFKSFLDTQNLLREAFRKGSVSRFRKNSFDMF